MADTSMSGIGVAAIAAAVVAVYGIAVYNDRNPSPAQLERPAETRQVSPPPTSSSPKSTRTLAKAVTTTRTPKGEIPPDAKPAGSSGAVTWQEKQTDGRVATVTRTPQSRPSSVPCTDSSKKWVLVSPGTVDPKTLWTNDAKYECR